MLQKLNKQLLARGVSIPQDRLEYGRMILHQYPSYFEYLPEEIKKGLFEEAIATDCQLIRHYSNVPEEIIWSILRKDPAMIKNICGATIEMCQYVLSVDPKLIASIDANTCHRNARVLLAKYDLKKMAFIAMVPENIQLLAVKKDPNNISLFPYPSDKVKAYVFERDPKLFPRIPNPCEDLCQRAFDYDMEMIKYIRNPTRGMIDRVIRENPPLAYSFRTNDLPLDFCDSMLDDHGCFIEKMAKRTQEQCLRAFESYPPAIRYIDNPSEDMCWKALQYDPYLFDDILAEMTDEMKWYMLKNHEDILLDCDDTSFDMTPDMIRYCVETNPELLCLVDSIPREICYEILDKFPRNGIKYISDPTKEICYAALERSLNNIKYISEYQVEIILFALRKDPKLIYHIYYPRPIMCFVALLLDPQTIHILKNGAWLEGFVDDFHAVAQGQECQKQEYWEARAYLGL